MDESLDKTNIKNEPTDSTLRGQLENSTGMQVDLAKQDNCYLIHSKLGIEMEFQEGESEFPAIASISYNMCPSYDMKFVTHEPLIKIEHENLENDILQDPLDVGHEIKDERHFPIDLHQSEPRIKAEPTEGEKEEIFLETDKDYSQSSGSNVGQDQLLIRNELDCTIEKNVCHECNKTFKRKWRLDSHSRIHTEENPFTCSDCNKSFNNKGILNNHMFIHRGEKPYSCDVCQKVFTLKGNLIKHKLIHSGVKSFTCDVCHKSFTRKSNLVDHKQIHTDNKPYTCDLCKKAFRLKSHFTVHRHTHTGEKPYSCDICNKLFGSKSNLIQHKKIHKN